MEGLFLPLLLMLVVAIPLVMGTRKQKKAMAQQQELQSSLAEGDRVMTTSGLYATVADASDDSTIDLEIAEGVVTTWLRQAVRERINPVADEDTADADDDSTDGTGGTDSADGATRASTDGDSEQVASSVEQGKK
ncbi:preprotein translocase subunit YajC [Prauserella shujinwangii]|uniref:Preprotein translocase subunit YajC n=1 Tax=Prauserella shujinwangii TaxID=1453103 RepID=A0A2T0LRL9_9PSEU|nr:preprotein translocase subunit YajC [Prauserella shujinwangii]PRX46149.1 preprotein translocase subunit YajC [Prauserella shujinwangii]